MFSSVIQISNRFSWAIFPVVAVLYFAAAEMGHALSFSGNFATFWPPAGIALAAYLYVPRRSWIWVLLGTMAGNLSSDILLHDKNLSVSFLFWMANTCEALVAYFLIYELNKEASFLWTPRA